MRSFKIVFIFVTKIYNNRVDHVIFVKCVPHKNTQNSECTITCRPRDIFPIFSYFEAMADARAVHVIYFHMLQAMADARARAPLRPDIASFT